MAPTPSRKRKLLAQEPEQEAPMLDLGYPALTHMHEVSNLAPPESPRGVQVVMECPSAPKKMRWLRM